MHIKSPQITSTTVLQERIVAAAETMGTCKVVENVNVCGRNFDDAVSYCIMYCIFTMNCFGYNANEL